MCGDIRRSGVESSPAGAKESRPAREWGGARLLISGPHWGHDQVTLPLCSLAVCWQGGTEHLYPKICCQIEKGQGTEEDDPDLKPVLPSLWPWGGPVCLCDVCARQPLCVYLFPRSVCVLCSSLALHPRLPLSCGPLSSGHKAGFLISRDRERCLGCTGVARGVVARGRWPWGEESFLCQIPKCHSGAACAA